MSRKPFVILAETHRAAVVAADIAPHAIRISAGERGWINRWIEAPGDSRVMIIVDDGSRIGDLAWAARPETGKPIRLGFLGPRLSEAGLGDRSLSARSIGSRLGWSPVRQKRNHLVVFECPADTVTAQALALATLLLNPDRDGSPSEWRVGFVGPMGMALFGDWGRSWYLDPSSEVSVEETVGGNLDLLFIDDDPAGWDGEAVVPLVDQARRIGAHLIGVSTGAGRNVWDDVSPAVDLVVASGGEGHGTAAIGPGVDVRVVNPIGFRRESESVLASVATVPLDLVGDSLVQDVRGRPTELVDGVALTKRGSVAVTPGVEDLIRSLRSYRAVLDHPRLHRSQADRARVLSWMACAGLPVVAEPFTESLAAVLGPGLTQVLAQGDLASMEDPDVRERYCIDLRRAALREVSLSARLRAIGNQIGQEIAPLPSVSVVMATMRPDYLEHATSQLAAQTYPDMEVVVALHGDRFPPGAERDLKALDLNVEVVRFDDSHNLGDVLNGAIERTSGQLVSKWDDDDWYGPEHLWDLVLATEYSSADAVGKAAEFVYVADLDITIRRFPDGAESPSKTLAGGTLTLHRQVLRSIGGFPSVPRHVDQGLLTRLADEGGTSFRTHGLGYLLNRHGEHTWNIATDYFLDASFRQWRGLGLGPAGIDASAPARVG